jgi:hypothetical protein
MINKKINRDIGPKGNQSIENFYGMYMNTIYNELDFWNI